MPRAKARPNPVPEDAEQRLDRAQEILGHTFHDRDVLRRALTHPSYSKERGSEEQYERLEFLGDSVLGFLVADYLYRKFPAFDEGRMSKLRSALVNGRTLAAIATEISLGECLLIAQAPESEGARRLVSVLSDAFEATVAALYLDAGVETARAYLMRVFAERLEPDALSVAVAEPKSELQERTMATSGETPVYRIVAQVGPPHDRTFTAEVLLAGRLLGQGSGQSKKDAEKAAATEALKALAEVDERPPKRS